MTCCGFHATEPVQVWPVYPPAGRDAFFNFKAWPDGTLKLIGVVGSVSHERARRLHAQVRRSLRPQLATLNHPIGMSLLQYVARKRKRARVLLLFCCYASVGRAASWVVCFARRVAFASGYGHQ
jgi:hypothetical protein